MRRMTQTLFPTLLVSAICWLLGPPACNAAAAGLAPAELRCEYRVNPVGIDVTQPRLSWTLGAAAADARGLTQAAYQVMVAGTPEKLAADQGDLWDSGKVESDQQLHIEYAGKPLAPRMRCHWKVRVWDHDGKPSGWSKPAMWSMGLLEAGNWQAKWIADIDNPNVGPQPVTLVRKSFQLDHPVRRATAYASALGVYELRLNGQRVGDDLLAPEWTSYRKRVQYQTYDVTALLRQGENAAAALLGEGWFDGRLMSAGLHANGSRPRFLLQLEIEFADGQTQTIVTDGSWRATSDGPIRLSGIYDGEVYDARKEFAGWDAPRFDAAAWRPAQGFALDERKLVWQRNEPIRVEQELAPVKLTEPKPGMFVFDFGQNMVGWCRLKAAGAAGQTVTLRHGEMLNDDGTLYTANLRGALQTDRYTPKADGEFVFEPHFTYHGFRFVEVTGLAKPPSQGAVAGRVFHSASPLTGRFECSDSSLNRLMQNILWSQRGNLMSVPTDCPQRDERCGWLGDIQVFGQTAIYNMNLAAFLAKFAQDLRDDQNGDGCFPDYAPHPSTHSGGSPGWADAGVILPWRSWQNYADRRLLEEHFEAARRWVERGHRNNPELIWPKNDNLGNDWLNGDWIKQAGWPSYGGAVPSQVFSTAYFAHSTDLVAKMAGVLGRKEDAQRYGELFQQIKAAFNQRFVKPDGRIEGDTQGGYALALDFNLLPDELRPKAASLLVENIRRYQNHLSTGIQTTHRAMLELTRNGHNEVAWQLLTNRTVPSWLGMVDNGATTIFERWDGYVKGRGFMDGGMNSFNHYALGAVGEWMWRNIAGLNPDDAQPGWKHCVISPRPGGGVTWARSEYDSIRGPIRSDWRVAGGRFILKVTIPPNTTATVAVPTMQPGDVTESGQPAANAKGVKFLRAEKDTVLYEAGSGTYIFEAPFPSEAYVNEIEKSIYNVLPPNQEGAKGIRGSLPEYIFSTAKDGLYVNLFEPSSIRWKVAAQDVSLTMNSRFPQEPKVELKLGTAKPTAMKLRVRVPAWAAADMPIAVNGKQAATGKPGSYALLDRTWADGDTVTFTLPMGFRATLQTGGDQIKEHGRYALEYGPVLLATASPLDDKLRMRIVQAPESPGAWLLPKPGEPLHFTVKDHPDWEFMPCWDLGQRTYTCYPIIEPLVIEGVTPFTKTTEVKIISAVPGAVIRYTTDGSEPTAQSPAYSGTLKLDRSCLLRARIFAGGNPHSPAVGRRFQCRSLEARVTVTVPQGLKAGDRYRLVFVTSAKTWAFPGADPAAPKSLDDYNAFATKTATAVPALSALGTSWKAVVSVSPANGTPVSAKSNTKTDPAADGAGVPIYNLAGALVANDNSDLWDGTIQNPIDMTELGTSPPDLGGDKHLVWTGTTSSGDATSGWSLLVPGSWKYFGNAMLTDTINGNPTVSWIASLGPQQGWPWDGGTDKTPMPIYVMSGILTAK